MSPFSRCLHLLAHDTAAALVLPVVANTLKPHRWSSRVSSSPLSPRSVSCQVYCSAFGGRGLLPDWQVAPAAWRRAAAGAQDVAGCQVGVGGRRWKSWAQSTP